MVLYTYSPTQALLKRQRVEVFQRCWQYAYAVPFSPLNMSFFCGHHCLQKKLSGHSIATNWLHPHQECNSNDPKNSGREKMFPPLFIKEMLGMFFLPGTHRTGCLCLSQVPSLYDLISQAPPGYSIDNSGVPPPHPIPSAPRSPCFI